MGSHLNILHLEFVVFGPPLPVDERTFQQVLDALILRLKTSQSLRLKIPALDWV